MVECYIGFDVIHLFQHKHIRIDVVVMKRCNSFYAFNSLNNTNNNNKEQQQQISHTFNEPANRPTNPPSDKHISDKMYTLAFSC